MPENNFDPSNHALRADSLEELLNVLKLREEFSSITNQNDWFALDLVEHANLQLILDKLNDILELKLDLNQIELKDVLVDIVNQAKANPQINNSTVLACEAIIHAPGCLNFDTVTFDRTSGELKLPGLYPGIDALFSTFSSSNLSQGVGVRLYNYLADKTPAVFCLDLGQGNGATLLINNKLLLQKRILLVKSQQDDGTIKVRPFMLAAPPQMPPFYHFIIDVSGSMVDDNKLGVAQSSVLNFAEILFSFVPRAKLFVNVFDSSYRLLGNRAFSQVSFSELKSEITNLSVVGSPGTDIAGACTHKIRECIYNSSQNNVVLFTDGEDRATKDKQQKLLDDLAQLTPEQMAKNQFYIISFAKQPEHLQRVVQSFNSKLYIEKTADFLAVLVNKQSLATWVAARDLLTISFEIGNVVNSADLVSYNRKCSVIQSNQLVELPEFTLTPEGGMVNLTVKDSSDNIVSEITQLVTGCAPVSQVSMGSDSASSLVVNSVFNFASATGGAQPSESAQEKTL